MYTSASLLPDLKTLTDGLTSIFNDNGAMSGRVAVLNREPNVYSSNSRSEIVTCRLADRRELQLFCKYEDRDGQSWSDVAYEAEVYRHVLQPLQVSTLAFYGAYKETTTGRTWLILEHLGDSMSLDELGTSAAMGLAARWIGQFHAAFEERLSSIAMPFLKTYDTEFYLERARRSLEFAGELRHSFLWLPILCESLQEFLTPLLAMRRTVSHSDYYLNNILFRSGVIYPIEWEMAGMDVGEIDLVSLTDGWPAKTQRYCELEYQRARWPQGAPADSELMLRTAELCLCIYRVARPNWTSDEECLWYCRRLHSLAERLGLV